MHRVHLPLCVFVGMFLVLLSQPGWAGVEAGLDATLRSDYETALKEFRALSEQGNAVAQFNLGVMYDKGWGVTQDYTEAVRWYRLAAVQGLVKAQVYLGMMYYRGEGVRQDHVQAHMWLNLAGAQGEKNAASFRDMLAAEMKPAQVIEAQKLAREWKPETNR